ncbi:hypothetical protein [Komagataeibacter europaeus]|uniref:hypothetical protein n=1 Tax=Komagataeibacter europaeus TaxID=33995 RepID=UPI000237DEB6|nr:hypothetical protein [Komagataeibacter europaeus]
MCGSEELIHDARQFDLEEIIMTNETPMYLVPGRLTDGQRDKIISIIVDCSDPETDLSGSELQAFRDMTDRVVAAVLSGYGPIQPCADVETVGYVPDKANLFADKRLGITNIYRSAGEPWLIPLVRRTDMAAQVARVAAEKDAEIARISDALKKMTAIAVGRASEQTVEAMILEHTERLRSVIANAAVDLVEGVDTTSVCRNLRAALNEGAAG